MRIEYTIEQKIEWYEKKLLAVLKAGAESKNVHEAMFHADAASFITMRLKRLLRRKE